MLSALAPARRRLVVASAVVLVVAAAIVTGVVVDRANRSTRAVDQSTAGPVLLVPGYGGSTSSLQTLAASLRAAGRVVVVVSVPGGGTGDLRQQAEVLDTAATSARQQAGTPSVDVVGYSAGGVVARLWVRDYGGAAIARRIVTLGSPHHGTDLATTAGSLVGCPVACQQLQPDSDLLNRLNAGDETPAGPLWVSIWTSADTVVDPPSSSRLDGATNVLLQDVCPSADATHGQLPTDPLVIGLVRLELSGPSTSAPSAGACAALSS